MLTLYLREVEAVERLPDSEKHEVGDVDYIVDGTLSGCHKKFLEPLGRFGHLDAAHRHAAIARTALGVFHGDLYSALVGIGHEPGYVGNVDLC